MLARYTGTARLHQAIRYGGALLFAAFIVRRLMQYGDFALKPLWAAETLVYCALFCAFLTRVDPIDRSTGWRDIVVPLIGAVLPFALLTTPPRESVVADAMRLQTVFWCMTGGTALTVWG